MRQTTAFPEYEFDKVLSEDGACRVYTGTAEDGSPVAIKILNSTSADKRRRF